MFIRRRGPPLVGSADRRLPKRLSNSSPERVQILLINLCDPNPMRTGVSRMKLNCFHTTCLPSSHSLNPIQLPAPMETHLWYVKPSEVKSQSLLKQYFDILSPCERENVLRMQGEELRKGALLARALVRTTIARYQINSQIDPRSLKFQKNIHGKPEVHWQENDDWDPPPLHFNISHTSSLVACGVTVNSEIGIDVEEKHRRTKHNTLSFARRYFSECEVQFLAAISDPQDQQMEFIKLWTLKEAYVKALGKGFSGAPFKTFTIRFKEDTSTQASDIVVDSFDDVRSWQFSLLELANSHYAAICTEKHAASVGEKNIPGKLRVWKTIPLLEDECVSGTDAVKTVCGF